LISPRGKSLSGLDEFTAALDHAGIPAVWLTSRSRLQIDDPRRKLAHTHPFIAEDGCGVYLPEDYFHLRPESTIARSQKTSTVRLGRFTCIPIAELQPAAAQALESLSEDTGVATVTLRSLSPRELVQNSGLPLREAELARQRDFDELFFFAGASEEDMQRFLAEASNRKLQLRQHGVLWSLAIGASVQRCIHYLSRLYDRALRYHPASVAIATPRQAAGLFPACDRVLFLTDKSTDTDSHAPRLNARIEHIPLFAPDTWERLLEAISTRS
jgi:predicted mannosyl-3-phosphoglycerate phosphatase (HAD superfamily)